MRFDHHSLRIKIALLVVLPSALGLAIFTTAVTGRTARDSSEMLDHEILALADVIGQNSTAALDFTDRRSGNSVLQALKRVPAVLDGCLYDIRGDLFSEFRRDSTSPPCAAKVTDRATARSASRVYSRSIIRDTEQIGTIVLLADRKELQKHIHRSFEFALSLAFISLGIGSFAGQRLQRLITRPFLELVSAMQKVTSQGVFEASVPIRGEDEIAQLSLSFNAMLTELQRRGDNALKAELKLRELARTDALTGLPNRRQFYERLHHETIRAARDGSLFGLLYIDLDGFKWVNDTLGHALGDSLLCAVADRIKARLRQSDMLARLGGDEFTVIVPNLSDEKNACAIALSLVAALSEPFDLEGGQCSIGASIGMLTHRGHCTSEDEILGHADAAMYAAKHRGKNQVMVYSETSGEILQTC